MAEKNTQRSKLEITYARLRARYVSRLKDGVEAVDNILAQRTLGPLLKQDLVRAQYLVHSFAGSGTTLGFKKITDDAKKIERFIESVSGPMALGEEVNELSYKTLEKMLIEFQCLMLSEARKEPATEYDEHDGSSLGSRDDEGRKILVVDDDYFLTEVIRASLQTSGFDVTVCRNGLEALSALSENRPDLVVLDISMPEISGHEVLKRLKQSAEFVRVPVVMLTGSHKQDDIDNAFFAGAAAYITKPFDIEALAENIRTILVESEAQARSETRSVLT